MRSSWVDALLVAAQGRRALGDLAGAQDALERAVGLDPTRAEVHNNLGDIYCRSRDAGRAEQSFLRALEIRSDFPAARNNLAAARGGGCRG
jgi:Flp pilus assembly protein TadD